MMTEILLVHQVEGVEVVGQQQLVEQEELEEEEVHLQVEQEVQVVLEDHLPLAVLEVQEVHLREEEEDHQLEVGEDSQGVLGVLEVLGAHWGLSWCDDDQEVEVVEVLQCSVGQPCDALASLLHLLASSSCTPCPRRCRSGCGTGAETVAEAESSWVAVVAIAAAVAAPAGEELLGEVVGALAVHYLHC